MRKSQINQRVVLSALILVTLNSWLVLPGSVRERPLGDPPNVASAPASWPSKTDSATRAKVTESYGKHPLSFEANEGQFDSRVKFVSRAGSQTLFLTATDAVLTLAGSGRATRPERPVLSSVPDSQPTATVEAQGAALRMRLVGANPNARVTGLDGLPGKSNYFIGKDPKKWRTNVSTYERVKYEHVYPGVDLVYYGNPSQLEYDLIVAPGADRNRIRLGFAGYRKMRIDEAGDLVFSTAAGEVRQHKPLVYQELKEARELVPAEYATRDNGEVSICVGRYDTSKPLFIDPVLSYSTYLGGDETDGGAAIAVDQSGSAYVTGNTRSTNFPTVNSLKEPPQSSFDAFVAKLDPTGSRLVYATYLGGSSGDAGRGISVDAVGAAYVIGDTSSSDFPVVNAFQSARLATQTAFATKLNATGSALVYSTYLGGARGESALGVAVDSAGSAYITGVTFSTDFPTVNAIQPTASETVTAYGDAFLTKLAPSGSSLQYSTYLGGLGEDAGRAVAVDAAGNAYLAGHTRSANFPTVNPLQPGFGGPCFKTTNGGGSWRSMSDGFRSFAILSMAVSRTDPTTVYATGERGSAVFKTTDAGNSWRSVSNGLPTDVAYRAIAVDQTNPSIVLAAQFTSVRKSVDGGANWAFSSIGFNAGSILTLAIDPKTPSTVYAGTIDAGIPRASIFKSTDGGASWARSSVGASSTPISSLAIDPANTSVLYAGGRNRVFKSTDAGTTWSNISSFSSDVTPLAIDPSNSSIVYFGSGNGVRKSTDGGTSFNLTGPELTGFVNTIVIDPLTPSTLYAGHSFGAGIFKSTNAGQSWSDMSAGLTIPNIKALAINPLDPSTLYVGTSAVTDAFVAKLNPSGSALVYSTTLGGRFDDSAFGIAVDAAGNAYVTGETTSSDFPITNAVQSGFGGDVDAFVVKLSPTGSTLIYSTFLGGNKIDEGLAIAIDKFGNACVTGITESGNFPIVDALQMGLAGSSDVFVAKIGANGLPLVYSTYFGGSGMDIGFGIAVDSAGSAYFTGSTESVGFPTTPGAFQTVNGGGSTDAFVSKIGSFDLCIQDDSNGNLLLVNTNTGDYQFINCSGGITRSGTGAITKRGCLMTLQVNGPDRRLLARIETCMKSGTATMQVFSPGAMFSILDRNTTNNTCACGGV